MFHAICLPFEIFKTKNYNLILKCHISEIVNLRDIVNAINVNTNSCVLIVLCFVWICLDNTTLHHLILSYHYLVFPLRTVGGQKDYDY